MAKKRRKPTDPPIEEGPALPDQRALEGRLWGVPAGLGEETPAAKAQELMYQAFEIADPARRVAKAREALQLWPDCADAYLLLAEHAPTRKEALQLYEQATAAGERALGPDCFQHEVGNFWGIQETRPYMRARAGLAELLWMNGRREEAIAHLQDLLRLNPGDNQGNRYTLAGYLLAEDKNVPLGLLLGQYGDDGSALWAYARALLAFRLNGDTAHARALLKEAKQVNKYVIPYLIDEKHPPMEPPLSYSPGSKEEALVCLGNILAGWKNTAGAVDWIRQVLKPKKKPAEARKPVGPSANLKARLADLDQLPETWQADVRQLPTVIKVGRDFKRPWIIVVFNPNTGMLLSTDVVEDDPTVDDVFARLARAMQRPGAGEPGRPSELEVRDLPFWRELASHLEELEIQLSFAENLDPLDEVLATLAGQMGEDEPPGLLQVPGMTPEKIGSFYSAAAEFFRQAPWRSIGYESAIQVECAKYSGGPWYGVLMGQSGLTMGFTLYDDLKLLRRLWNGQMSDEQNAKLTVATTVTFGRDIEIPLADVEAAQQYGWPVARNDAWPSPFRKERGMSMRPPLVWELELLEGCLRAVPEFLRRRKQADPTPEEMTVPVASGPLTLKLAWIEDDA